MNEGKQEPSPGSTRTVETGWRQGNWEKMAYRSFDTKDIIMPKPLSFLHRLENTI